ncbi:MULTISPECIES: hypothetical protein [Rhizobium]|uniref:hypothetical protein n=1 Tax=Rhizobium TaxID=379 RepID=UPI0030B8A7AB
MIDGNKQTGSLAAFAFLYVNGCLIDAENARIVAFVASVAACEIDEAGVTRFLRDFSVSLAR